MDCQDEVLERLAEIRREIHVLQVKVGALEIVGLNVEERQRYGELLSERVCLQEPPKVSRAVN